VFSIIAGDFNGDRKLDLAAGYWNGQDSGVWVLINRSDGTYGTGTRYALRCCAPFTPLSLEAVELNGDGRLDLVVILGSRSNVTHILGVLVLLNEGDGIFQEGQYTPTGRTSIAVADINGDGKADLVQPFESESSVGVYFNRGDGTFEAPIALLIPAFRVSSLSVVDLNDDGDRDLAVVGQRLSGSFPASGAVFVLLNAGDGSFKDPASYDIGRMDLHYSTSLLVAADLNADGTLDLAVGSQILSTEPNGPNHVSALINRGDGTFRPAVIYPSEYVISLTPGDWDGDRRIDLLMSQAFEPDRVLRLQGDGTVFFQSQKVSYVGEDFEGVLLKRAVDLTGDGKDDLVLALGYDLDGSLVDDSVKVLINKGEGTFSELGVYFVGAAVRALAMADLDNDGELDLAAGGVGGAT
jgi:hypothetical protein